MKKASWLALAALLPFAARPAGADPNLDRIVAAWATNPSTNMLPATAWEHLQFTDENGVQRKLYFRTADLALDAPAAGGLDVPLFVLDPAPQKSAAELTVPGTETYYTDCFFCDYGQEAHVRQITRTVHAQVATFRNNKLSVYYIKAKYGSDYVLSRKDKPELELPGQISGNWYMYDGIFTGVPCPPPATPGCTTWDWTTTQQTMKTIVFAPTAVDSAASSPITGVVRWNWCRGMTFADQPGSVLSPAQQIRRGIVPAEEELLDVEPTPELSSPAIWQTLLYRSAESGLNEGRFDPANAYIGDTRTKLVAAATALSARLKSAPVERFDPVESRWLACRMRHAGQEAETAFFGRIARDGGLTGESQRAEAQKSFVRKWRRFAIRELDRYAAEESPAIPRLPLDLKLKERDDALLARTRAALAGASEAPAGPDSGTVGSRPRVGERHQRSVDRSIDDILGR